MRRPSLQDNTAVSSMSSTPPEPIMEVPESERGASHVSVNTGMDWAADASPTSYNPSETSYVTPLAVVEKENETNRIQEQRVLGNAESTQRLLLRCDEFDAWKAIMDAFYALVAEDERESSLREATSHPCHPSQNNHNSHDSTNSKEEHLESQQQHTPKDTLIKVNGESLQNNATPSPTPAVQDEANMNGKDRHTTQVGQTRVPLLPHSYGTALSASLHTPSEPLLTRGSMSAETTYDRNGSAEQVLRQFFWPLTILSGPPRSSPSSPCSPAPVMVNYAATESEPRGVHTHSAAGRAAAADSTSAHPTDHRHNNNNRERLLRGYRTSSRDRELPALQDVSAESWAFATHPDRLSHKRDSLPAGGDKAAVNNNTADKSQPTSGNDYYYWQSLWVNSVTRQYLFFLLSFLYLGSILVLGAVWTMIDVFAAAPLPLYRNSHTTATSRNALHATALVAALGLTLMIFTFTDGVALMRSARWPQALLLLGPSAVVVGAMLVYHGGLRTELGITLAGAAVYGVGLGLAVLAACMLSFVEVGVAAGMVAQLNITLLSFLTLNALAYLVLPTLYNSAVTSERTVLKAAVYMTAVPFLYAVALLLLVPRAHIARAVAANDRHFRTRKLFVAVRHVSGRFVLRTLSFALVFSLVVLAADNAAVLFAPLPSLMTSRRPSRFVTLDAVTRTPGITNNNNNSEGVSAQVVLTTLGAQRVAAMVFVSAFMLWPLCFLPRLSSLLARSLLLLCAVIVMTLCWAAYARLPNGRRLVANAMWYMACACTTGVVFALLASSLLRSLLLIGESTWVVARRPGRETNIKAENNGKRDEKGQNDRPAADERTALLPNAQQDTQKENRSVQPLHGEGTIMEGDEATYSSAQDIELHDGPSAVVSLGMGVLLSSLVVCTTVLAVTSMLLRREMTPASSGAANATVMTLRAQLALKRMMLGLSVAAVVCELIQTALACRAATTTV